MALPTFQTKLLVFKTKKNIYVNWDRYVRGFQYCNLDKKVCVPTQHKYNMSKQAYLVTTSELSKLMGTNYISPFL